MVIIVFPNGSEWARANCAFRQLSEDVGQLFASETDLLQELERAQAIGALFLNDMEASLCNKMSSALKATAEGTIRGEIEGWRPGDHNGRPQYMESLTELLDLIQNQVEK